MMEDHDNPQKKRSIDEIIEHMTADIQASDGQYIALGFTPPATAPHGWSEYAASTNGSGDSHYFTPHTLMNMNSGENSMFVSDVSGVRYDINTSHLPKQGSEVSQHHNFYYATAAGQQQLNTMLENREVIGTVIDGGGNLFDVVYSSAASPHSYHMVSHDSRGPMKHPIGGFIPYQSGNLDHSNHLRGYGLFSSDIQQSQQGGRQQSQHFQGTVSNQAQLIENLVGNWVPNQSGTYSPFGCTDTGVRPLPPTNQQGIQTVPVSSDTEMEYKGIGRGVRKARIVAEVRPMRPTYSDVLTKSASVTLQTLKSNSNTANIPNKLESTNVARSKVPVLKGSNARKNNKSGILKRQHSSGSDEHNGNGNFNSSKLTQSPVVTQKTVGSDVKHNGSGIGLNSVPQKWVSLDDLNTDKQIIGELGEEVFESEDVVSTKTPQSGSCSAVGEGSNKKLVGMSNSKPKYGQQGKCYSLLITIVTFLGTLEAELTRQPDIQNIIQNLTLLLPKY